MKNNNFIPVKKNEEYTVTILDNGYEGEGIAKIDNFTIFVPNTLKGEKVKIHIVKVLSSHAYGKVIEFIEKSEVRQEVDCSTYKRCGGCNLRHVCYEETLNMKQNMVQNLVNKTLKNKIEVKKTIGMGIPYNYRNKAQFPVGMDRDGNKIMGVYANRSHEIIPTENCMIQNTKLEEISKFIFNFIKTHDIEVYCEKTGKGLVRHIVTKIGIQTNQIMCILVLNGEKLPYEKELVEKLVKNYGVKTIIKNINTKNTNVILGDKNITIYGDGYIKDFLGDYVFKISPMSFYQINPVQTEVLYNTAIDMSGIREGKVKTAFDLYCGIGTIAIFISEYVDKVYGIEIVEQAIEDAKENARINDVKNTEFMVGDVEFALEELINNRNIVPDVVFVDPPRKGLDSNTINNLMKINTNKIVYISCNPATMVRDLAKLEEKYDVGEIKTVDMFPFTSHVECVALMGRKEAKNS